MHEVIVALLTFSISVLLIALFILTLGDAISYFRKNLCGWYRKRKTDTAIERWKRTQTKFHTSVKMSRG